MSKQQLEQPDNMGGGRIHPLRRSLPIMLLRAREKVMAPIREMLAGADVTEQQWRVLRVLAEHGEMEARDAAEHAVLLMPSLTRITQTLEHKSLIERRVHGGDRRRLILTITPKGQKIIDDNAVKSHAIMAAIREQFGERQFEELLDLLNALDQIETSKSR